MLHPQLGDSSITPLRKLLLYSSISLLAYQGFELELPRKRVILHTKTLNRNNRLGITDTLLKHGNMENRINRSQFTRKIQFIGSLTNSLQDFIWTHITSTELAFLSKSNHPFHRQNFKIHFIRFFKLQILSPMIGIRLLLTRGRLRPVPYDMNFLQSLINQIGTKKQGLPTSNHTIGDLHLLPYKAL